MMKLHSKNCPCDEHVKVQSEFFSDFIQNLVKASPKIQKKLLKNCSACFIQFMCNCAKGVLKGDIKLSKNRLQKLSSDKKVLMKLIRPSIPLQKKKRILHQRTKRRISWNSSRNCCLSTFITSWKSTLESFLKKWPNQSQLLKMKH
jgi:hypothetical protein